MAHAARPCHRPSSLPSAGNFLLVRFPDATAAAAFLNARGIIPRVMAPYGLNDCLRITIGTAEEMEIVAAALDDFAAGNRRAGAA